MKNGSRLPVTSGTSKSNSKDSARVSQNGYASPSSMMPPPPPPVNSFIDTAATSSLQAPVFPGMPQVNKNVVILLFTFMFIFQIF